MEVRLVSEQIYPPKVLSYPADKAESVIAILMIALGFQKMPGAKIVKVDIYINLPINPKK